MAKKAAKKSAKKAGKPSKKTRKSAANKPTAKKSARKKAAPKRAASSPARKKARKSAGSLNPTPVSTGRGPTPTDIGTDLVAMFNQGQLSEIEKKWHSPNIVSIEGASVALAWKGKKALQAKNEHWYQTSKIHGASAEGPYLGASGFAVKFTMDIENIPTGSRTMMEEVGVYTVEKGKIVREEFMYGKVTPVSGGSTPVQ